MPIEHPQRTAYVAALRLLASYRVIDTQLLDEHPQRLTESDVMPPHQPPDFPQLTPRRSQRRPGWRTRESRGEREVVNLHTLIGEHVELAYHGKRAQVPGFTVAVERDNDEAVGQVEVVPQDLGRVILNLVGNAFGAVTERATSINGQYEPMVRVTTCKKEEAVEIRVTDNGPGMSEEVRKKIFEPFFTTKPAGSGTGLGLSLSYGIITQGHGGTLTVESDEGEGAAFVISLPASSSQTIDPSQATP